jgi:hypothetical protein
MRHNKKQLALAKEILSSSESLYENFSLCLSVFQRKFQLSIFPVHSHHEVSGLGQGWQLIEQIIYIIIKLDRLLKNCYFHLTWKAY